jgi:hypothetical protein
MKWTALIALGVPEACNVAARSERGQVVLMRVERGHLLGSKPVTDFLPDDQQDLKAQRRWALAATLKWGYDNFDKPLPEADTLEALAALVPSRYPAA